MGKRFIFGLIALLVLLFIGLIIFGQNNNQAQVPSDNNAERAVISNPVTQSAGRIISKGGLPDVNLDLHDGFVVHKFASNLESPRDMEFSPGGTLLVSDPAGGKVFALPDKNNDGVADEVKTVISGENRAHGLAFYDGKLFVAEVDKVLRYDWDEDDLTASGRRELFGLPENNNHSSRTIVFDSAGKMFVSVGSTCNVCVEKNRESGTIITSDAEGRNPHVYASGLRNAPFMTFKPGSDELWATEMGRDYLGDDLPPDEINVVFENGDYGWPYCYGNKIHDDNFDPRHLHDCAKTTGPLFEIPAHSAPLGLAFVESKQFPDDWQGDLLVAYHGSWNSTKPVGYKVVRLKIQGEKVMGAEDFLSGLTPSNTPNTPGNRNNNAVSRPVDFIFDKAGNLYLSDDKGGNIYIIQKYN